MLVSERFSGMGFTQRIAAVTEHWDLPESAGVICYTPEEFDRKSAELGVARVIRQEGIELRFPAGGPACT